jgi:hypothetical protein
MMMYPQTPLDAHGNPQYGGPAQWMPPQGMYQPGQQHMQHPQQHMQSIPNPQQTEGQSGDAEGQGKVDGKPPDTPHAQNQAHQAQQPHGGHNPHANPYARWQGQMPMGGMGGMGGMSYGMGYNPQGQVGGSAANPNAPLGNPQDMGAGYQGGAPMQHAVYGDPSGGMAGMAGMHAGMPRMPGMPLVMMSQHPGVRPQAPMMDGGRRALFDPKAKPQRNSSSGSNSGNTNSNSNS